MENPNGPWMEQMRKWLQISSVIRPADRISDALRIYEDVCPLRIDKHQSRLQLVEGVFEIIGVSGVDQALSLRF
jgi:hypothetical protein